MPIIHPVGHAREPVGELIAFRKGQPAALHVEKIGAQLRSGSRARLAPRFRCALVALGRILIGALEHGADLILQQAYRAIGGTLSRVDSRLMPIKKRR